MGKLFNYAVATTIVATAVITASVYPKPAKAGLCDCFPVRQLMSGKTLYLCCNFRGDCYYQASYFEPFSC